ncbi:MAG: peptide ABC transporter substrate-binding protein [Nocardioidaceae bacterium]
MSRKARVAQAAAGIAALALVATGCGGGGGGGGGTGQASGGEGGSFSYAIQEPEALAPVSNCYESECIGVLNALYTPLLKIDTKTGEPEFQQAKSITTKDSKVWTITLRKGWKFHNGEPVDADAYIRAWNYAAYGPHAVRINFFFERVKGYDAMNEKNPTTKKLTGLEKVNDYKFKVILEKPFSQWIDVMSYIGFAPMAKACVKDIHACNDHPIGDGPYKMDGDWQHNRKIELAKYDGYKGQDAGRADHITMRIYSDMATAYNDWVSGELDIVEPTPEKVKTARQQAGDRIEQKASSAYYGLGFPTYIKAYDNKKLRQAISLSINRKAITDNIMTLLRPATDVISPAVPGSRSDACDYCDYDPQRAKKLFKEAGGFPSGKKIVLWVNSGEGNEQWMQAIGNQLKKTLGVDFQIKSVVSSRYFDSLDAGKATGPYYLSWIMDYPSPENYLRALYSEKGLSNRTGWSNPKFEKYMAKGDAAPTIKAGVKYYQKAADVVLEDLPGVPLFFSTAMYVYSTNVTNVHYDPAITNVDVTQVKVTS